MTQRPVRRETIETKIRRVYSAQKKRWGLEAQRGYQFFTSVRNQARLSTAHIVGDPVARVKAVLAATAGPETTPRDRRPARANAHYFETRPKDTAA
jgi:hypothetical protein